jgi:hypothetical protein
METTISASAISKIKNTDKAVSQKKFWDMLEFNRFGVIAWVLAIVACTSGITAGLFVDGTSQLDITLVALPTMLTLCTILIVAPMRWIVGIGVAAFLIDLMIVVF